MKLGVLSLLKAETPLFPKEKLEKEEEEEGLSLLLLLLLLPLRMLLSRGISLFRCAEILTSSSTSASVTGATVTGIRCALLLPKCVFLPRVPVSSRVLPLVRVKVLGLGFRWAGLGEGRVCVMCVLGLCEGTSVCGLREFVSTLPLV